jgi:CheY-like chemotaxis protein
MTNVTDVHSPAESPATPPRILGLVSGRRVLVVDDEQLIRWSLAERLRQDGYDIVEAGTAAEALDRAEQGIDLVLLDYKLPDDDGLSVLKKIRDLDPDTLVIMLTAHKSVETAVEAMKAGAFDYATSRSTSMTWRCACRARSKRRACAASCARCAIRSPGPTGWRPSSASPSRCSASSNWSAKWRRATDPP